MKKTNYDYDKYNYERSLFDEYITHAKDYSRYDEESPMDYSEDIWNEVQDIMYS